MVNNHLVLNPHYQVKPSLRPFAENDRASWDSFQKLSGESVLRLGRLRHPLGTWTGIVAKKPQESRFSLQSCKNRYQADHEIDLDDQGIVNDRSVRRELESQNIIAEQRSKWAETTSVRLGRQQHL